MRSTTCRARWTTTACRSCAGWKPAPTSPPGSASGRRSTRGWSPGSTEQPVHEAAGNITGEHGEQAAWPSPVESSLQRRPDLPVDDQIREMVEVGLLAIDDDHARASLLRQSWEPRGRIDFE